MASAIYILDENLNQLISRQYKYDLNSPRVLSQFKRALATSDVVSPVIQFEGYNFVYLSYDEIIILTVCFDNINIMALASFLQKFAKLLTDYFVTFGVFKSRAAKLNHAEDSDHYIINADVVRENYILIYELFDEILDFGVPQLTEFNILKEYIKLIHIDTDGAVNNDYDDGLDARALKKKGTGIRKTSAQQQVDTTMSTLINSSISRTSTTKISWRPKGIFYKKNEIFINFNEVLRFQYNLETEHIMSNFISGAVECRSYLSGMPTLTLGLNERLITDFYSEAEDASNTKLIFDNINFHQCVELHHVATNNAISFIPPDGSFTLLNYQIVTGSSNALKPLILVRPSYEIFKTVKRKTSEVKYKLQIAVSLQTNFKKKYSMKKVNVVLPLVIKQIQHEMSDLTTLLINYNVAPKFKSKVGNVVLNLEGETVIWRIPALDGGIKPTSDEFKMLCEFELMTKDSFIRDLHDNEYHGKQDKNALFYVEIQEELKKLRVGHVFEPVGTPLKKHSRNLSADIHDDFELQSPTSPTVLSKPVGDLEHQKQKALKNKHKDLVRVSFELTAMTYSGLKVEYLKIEEPQLHFQSFPWVRYLVESKDGDYLFKLGESCFQNSLTLEDFNLPDESKEDTMVPETQQTEETQGHVSETNLARVEKKQFNYRGRAISFAEYVATGEEVQEVHEVHEVREKPEDPGEPESFDGPERTADSDVPTESSEI